MKRKIGYTTGVFDLFHIGHLNILRNARALCDELIVGVTSDELVEKNKKKKTVIPFEERMEIVGNIKFVDRVVGQLEIDEIADYYKYGFDVIFKGDDWKGTKKWNRLEQEFKNVGVEVIYFPYTKKTSSTIINEYLLEDLSKRNNVL